MTAAWASGHDHKTRVKLFCANKGCAPLNEVVLKYTLVKLVEEVRCEAGKDVAVGEVSPEW